jgi:single-strand DNA-binding protein
MSWPLARPSCIKKRSNAYWGEFIANEQSKEPRFSSGWLSHQVFHAWYREASMSLNVNLNLSYHIKYLKGDSYMLNRWIGIGRLVADPELRYTQSGTAVASLRIAVQRDSRSEGQPDADFINVSAWGKLGETVAKYQRKGKMIAVTGSIRVRTYDAPDGKRTAWEIHAEEINFLSPAEGARNGEAPTQQAPAPQPQYQQPQPQHTQPYAPVGAVPVPNDNDLW